MTSRRSFLHASGLVTLSPTIPTYLARTALAVEPKRDERVLVVLQLSGGNDGINTVVPHADEGYARSRKILRLPTKDLLRINDRLGLHPAMRNMAKLLEQGSLAIVQGVGYPNPDRSHFQSLMYWQTARFDSQTDGARNKSGLDREVGWLGRALDARYSNPDKAPASVFIGHNATPVALQGARATSASFGSLGELSLPSGDNSSFSTSATKPGEDLSSFVQRSVADAYTTADILGASARMDEARRIYPSSPLAEKLRLVARLIKADFGPRVYYVEHGTDAHNYDTHVVQLPKHERLLDELSGAVAAFQADLASAKLVDRAMLVAFSEFGRRVAENDSRGTDHGTAAPVFVVGGAVRGGLFGETPSLTDLDDGDLKWSIDFRRIYATLLEGWLGLSAKEALAGSFSPLPFLLGGGVTEQRHQQPPTPIRSNPARISANSSLGPWRSRWPHASILF
jgi:uncharacterized protein (DUF1501 family)